MHLGVAVVLATLLVVASAAVSFTQPTKPPEISEILPASGPAGQAYPLQATIRGTGFMPTGNVVEFGPVKIPDLPSADGTRITFDVPKLMASRGGTQQIVLIPGQYRVAVTTSAGASNALTFTFTHDP